MQGEILVLHVGRPIFFLFLVLMFIRKKQFYFIEFIFIFITAFDIDFGNSGF